jgi:hypothetical protein
MPPINIVPHVGAIILHQAPRMMSTTIKVTDNIQHIVIEMRVPRNVHLSFLNRGLSRICLPSFSSCFDYCFSCG